MSSQNCWNVDQQVCQKDELYNKSTAFGNAVGVLWIWPTTNPQQIVQVESGLVEEQNFRDNQSHLAVWWT